MIHLLALLLAGEAFGCAGCGQLDFDPPEIVAFGTTPGLPLTLGPRGALDIVIDAVDQGSGLDRLTGTFANLNGKTRLDFHDWTGTFDPIKGRWRIRLTVPDFSQAYNVDTQAWNGDYALVELTLTDKAGNFRKYLYNPLTGLWRTYAYQTLPYYQLLDAPAPTGHLGGYSLTLVNMQSQVDTVAPVVTDLQTTPILPAVLGPGGTLDVSVAVREEGSGFRGATVSFRNRVSGVELPGAFFAGSEPGRVHGLVRVPDLSGDFRADPARFNGDYYLDDLAASDRAGNVGRLVFDRNAAPHFRIEGLTAPHDVDGPRLLSVELLSPARVRPNEPVEVRLNVSDDVSGFEDVLGVYRSATGLQFEFHTWECSREWGGALVCRVPARGEGADAAAFALTQLRLRDRAGNERRYAFDVAASRWSAEPWDDSQPSGAARFTVEPDDHEPPSIGAIRFRPELPVVLHGRESFEIEIDAIDDTAVERVEGVFRHALGNEFRFGRAETRQVAGAWLFRIDIPDYDSQFNLDPSRINGEYHLEQLIVSDRAKRVRTYTFDHAAKQWSGAPQLRPAHFYLKCTRYLTCIMEPKNGALLSRLPQIWGTAEGAVAGVELTIKDTADGGRFWDGAVYGSAERWVRTEGAARWSYQPVPQWRAGGSYQVTARALLSDGQTGMPDCSASFRFDDVPPTAAIQAPAASGCGLPTELRGTAADAHSELVGVEVALQQKDKGLWWDGVQWSSIETWLGARGGAEWQASLPPSASNDFGQSYRFFARARDRANNIGVPASVDYVYRGGVATIESPGDGRKVSGQRVTLQARVDCGRPSALLFEYRPEGGTWVPVPAANENHPNPDVTPPYFVHWNVSNLPEGRYEVRVVSLGPGSKTGHAGPSITLVVDNGAPELVEKPGDNGQGEKKQKVEKDAETRVVLGSADGLMELRLPSGAADEGTDVTLVRNPSNRPEPAKGWSFGGDRVDVHLSNGRHNLGATAELCLPYDKKLPLWKLKAAYFDPRDRKWETLEARADVSRGCMRFETDHFSSFGVLARGAAAEDAPFEAGEAYVFPNPARSGRTPKLHLEVGVADSIEGTIYDVSGERVGALRLSGEPATIDDGQGPEGAYETELGEFPSGSYFVAIEAKRSGKPSIKKTVKFAVIR